MPEDESEMTEGEIQDAAEAPEGETPETTEAPEAETSETGTPETTEAPGDGRPAEAAGGTKTWQIPVGTDVITTLGVSTTFSRLSAGDVIAVLTEAGTDNILKIWIVQ